MSNNKYLDTLDALLGYGDIESDIWIICKEESGEYKSEDMIKQQVNQIKNFDKIGILEKEYYSSVFDNKNLLNDTPTYKNIKQLLNVLNSSIEIGISGNYYLNMYPIAEGLNTKKIYIWDNYTKWFGISLDDYKQFCKNRILQIKEIVSAKNPNLVLLFEDWNDRFVKNNNETVYRENQSGVRIFKPNIIAANHPAQYKTSVDNWINDIVEAIGLLKENV